MNTKGRDLDLAADAWGGQMAPADGESSGEWLRAGVERVILAMRERLDNPLTLDEMAEVAHLSRFYFNRVFSGITGVSPRKFLATLRLDYAKRLLLTTTMSITDVCYETGYSSLGTFTTHFSTLVGVTPTQWRKLADRLDMPIEEVARLVREAHAALDRTSESIAGTVRIPESEGFNGLVFVGLFERQIPQALPVAGDLLFGAGQYRIPTVADGAYHVLAVAIPWPLDLQAFFLPSLMLRDGMGPCVVSGGRHEHPVDLSMREPLITDPPILIALPYLFIAYLGIG